MFFSRQVRENSITIASPPLKSKFMDPPTIHSSAHKKHITNLIENIYFICFFKVVVFEKNKSIYLWFMVRVVLTQCEI